MSWEEWELERLKRGCENGESYGQICRDLPGKSRNACLGKAHRMGYVRPQIVHRRTAIGLTGGLKRAAGDVSVAALPIEARERGTLPKMTPFNPSAVRSGKKEPYVPLAIVAPVDASFPRIDGVVQTVIGLQHHQCKWLIGEGTHDPELHFCTNRRVNERYCEAHEKASFAPSPKPRARRRAEYDAKH